MKKSIGRRMAAAVFSIVVAFGLAACGQGSQGGSDNQGSSDAQEAETTAPADSAQESEASAQNETSGSMGETLEVHVGDFLGETFLYPVKLAAELGMFEEEFAKDNIKICVDYLGSGAVMNEALTAGDLQMSFLGGQPTYSGIANGNGGKVITMATVSSTDPCLLVRADSDISEVSQLSGKNLAVNIGTDNHYQMIEMLSLGGVTEEDIHLYNLKGNEALSALLSGEIDCMQSIAPNKWRYVLDGDVRILTNMSETSGRNNQVLVATEEFRKEHGDIIVRFLKVLQRALDYYEENKEECWGILAKYCDADEELMEHYMEDYDCTLGLTEEDKAYMEHVYDFLYSHEMLITEIDLSSIYDESFLMEAFGTVDCH